MTRWLLLHGVPTGTRYWSRLELPGGVVAPDLPGIGTARSGAPWVSGAGVRDTGQPPGRTMHIEDHLARLRPSAGSDVTVVGVDYGGVLAARLAAEGRAGRLVLMSTALGAAWLPSRWAAWPPLSYPCYRWSAGQRFLRAADPTGELARAFPADEGLADRMIGLARRLDVGEMRRSRADLVARRIPTLCLWGDDDSFFPPASGRRLASQLGARWATVPGTHAVAWTNASAVTAALRDWTSG